MSEASGAAIITTEDETTISGTGELSVAGRPGFMEGAGVMADNHPARRIL
jgi:hypothetical protein